MNWRLKFLIFASAMATLAGITQSFEVALWVLGISACFLVIEYIAEGLKELVVLLNDN